MIPTVPEPTKISAGSSMALPVLGATGPELDPVHAKGGDQVAPGKWWPRTGAERGSYRTVWFMSQEAQMRPAA